MISINIDDNDEEAHIKRAFNFLIEHYQSGELFKKNKLKDFIKEPSFNTNFTKKYLPLLEEDLNQKNKYFVSERFKRYSNWSIFRQYFSQVEYIKPNYQEYCYKSVLMYEFFLPLNNESFLRSALDEIFFKDSVLKRVKRLSKNEIYNIFTKNENESNEQYFDRIVTWISNHFGGYSIDLVNGRFKVRDLMSHREVGEILSTGGRYLIDETTAIVRFIFYIGEPEDGQSKIESFLKTLEEKEKESSDEAKKIWYFFKNLFVKSILEVVSGEDEIWMLESGFNKPKLYVYKNIAQF